MSIKYIGYNPNGLLQQDGSFLLSQSNALTLPSAEAFTLYPSVEATCRLHYAPDVIRNLLSLQDIVRLLGEGWKLKVGHGYNKYIIEVPQCPKPIEVLMYLTSIKFKGECIKMTVSFQRRPATIKSHMEKNLIPQHIANSFVNTQ